MRSGRAGRARTTAAGGRGSSADGSASANPFAEEIARSTSGILGTSITFLTVINISVTASRLLAGEFALVGSVSIVVTGIAFFSGLNFAVATLRSISGDVGDNTVIEGLNSTRASTSSQSTSLSTRNRGSASGDIPINVLSARRSGHRTGVFNERNGGKSTQSFGQIGSASTSVARSARIEGTSG